MRDYQAVCWSTYELCVSAAESPTPRFSLCMLFQAIQLIQDEDFRSRKYVHPSSFNAAKMCVEERLSSDHLDMLHGECENLVKQESYKGILTSDQPARTQSDFLFNVRLIIIKLCYATIFFSKSEDGKICSSLFLCKPLFRNLIRLWVFVHRIALWDSLAMSRGYCKP